MGLDTRAYRRADQGWRQAWVEETNAAGERPVFFGLLVEKLEQAVTIDDAPDWHQDDLGDLDWPGGLVGGLLSGYGDGPSFRGKAYNDYVEAVTGRSLYDACGELEFWEGEVLADVTERLEAAATAGQPVNDDGYIPKVDERTALARWFRVCVDNDLAVGGDC